jgi:hypothetical protein
MVIRVEADLEKALSAAAQQQGRAPEELAISALRERFVSERTPLRPHDSWERRLLSIATDCGIGLSDQAVSSSGLYE